ncbi:hypothetical protein scyTo_0020655 [Scyliorhinus torazame]|uniref:H15 domain-containing protein n=1 Tax=Scyliorhinus torazame TaxID=75743 RepID=A0A401PYN5_SCYTO|nr:hypothetical protein [Scyliorhinus torazame]
MKAVAATKERRGLTVAAMKKMLSASGCKGRNSSRIARPPIRSLKRGSLVKAVGSLAASTSVKLGDRHERLTCGKLGPAASLPDAKKGAGSKAAMPNFNSKRPRRRPAVHRKGAPRRPVKLARKSRKGERRAERRRKKPSLFRRNTRIRRSISVLPVIRPHEESNPQNLPTQGVESTCGENVHSR